MPLKIYRQALLPNLCNVSAEKLDTIDEGTEEYREALWDLDDSWEDIQRIKHQLGQKKSFTHSDSDESAHQTLIKWIYI